MKIIYEDLYTFTPYRQATAWEIIKNAEKLDALNDYLDDTFPDGLTEAQFNEWLSSYVTEDVFRAIGMTPEEYQVAL